MQNRALDSFAALCSDGRKSKEYPALKQIHTAEIRNSKPGLLLRKGPAGTLWVA
jgi:hypothetical protein